MDNLEKQQKSMVKNALYVDLAKTNQSSLCTVGYKKPKREFQDESCDNNIFIFRVFIGYDNKTRNMLLMFTWNLNETF